MSDALTRRAMDLPGQPTWPIRVCRAAGLVLLAAILPAHSEFITLRNGKQIRGRILEESKESITVEKDGKRLTVARGDIERIVYGYDRQALERLNPQRPRDYLEQGAAMLGSEEPHVAQMGRHLIWLAARLDPHNLFAEANLVLASHEESIPNGAPSLYYRRILQANPSHTRARQRLDAWQEKHPGTALGRSESRSLLAKALRAILAGEDYAGALADLRRIAGPSPDGAPPVSLEELRRRCEAAAQQTPSTFVATEEELRQLRVFLLHIDSLSDNPFRQPGPRLPRLGEHTFEEGIDYSRTVFRDGRFVSP